MEGGRGTHLRSLTSLRFVAALLVVLVHISLFAPGLDPVGRLASVGYVGVTFFFVLSGFVLTYSWDPDAGARRFYRRRFARVYPMHVVFIAVAILTTGVTTGVSPNWAALPANLTLLQSWSPDDTVVRSFSGVSWSLSCELLFYAVFPLLVRGLARVRRPLAAGVGLVSAAFVVGLLVQSRSTDAALWLFHLPAFRIVEFTCGALAATALMRGWVPRLRIRWAGVSVLISYVGVLVLPVAIGYRVEDRWACTLAMTPSFVLLVSACAHRDLTGGRSPLQRPSLVALGQWSYCVYMAHPVIIMVTRPLLGVPTVAGALLGLALVLMTIIGVSFMLYVTVERPLERRLRGAGPPRASDIQGADVPMPADTGVPVSPGVLATD